MKPTEIQSAVLEERRRCIEAVNAEEEFPGDMPNSLWDKIQDMDMTKEDYTWLMRRIVQLTKQGILERINKP